jgi:hypothetical protein
MRAADRRRQHREEESPKQVIERRADGDPRAPMTPENVLALQRSAGNRALARAIAEAAPAAKAPARVVARRHPWERSRWDRITAVPGAIEANISHWRETRRKIRDDDKIAELEAKAKRAAERGARFEEKRLLTEARTLRSEREGEEDWYVAGEYLRPAPSVEEAKYEPPPWEFGDDD